MDLKDYGKKITGKGATVGWLYLLPALILLAIFGFYPIIRLIINSFFEWDGILEVQKWVGISNYADLLRDSEFWESVGNSFIFLLGTVPIGIAISLGLALLLRKNFTGNKIFRAIFFSPVITSLVAAGITWVWIFNNDGIINLLLEKLNLDKINWQTNGSSAMLSVIIMTIWKDVGYSMIIFLGGLSTISKKYYEAAELDGASSWQKFRFITWPLLLPTTFFILITRIIFSFRAFEQIYAMTRGGPINATTTMIYFAWDRAFGSYSQIGYASAAAVFLLVLVLIITVLHLKFAKTPYKY